MVRCVALRSWVAASESPSPPSSLRISSARRQTRCRCFHAASAPAAVHSTSRSGGLSDMTNQRAVSAPYCSTMSCGSTTFFFDFDILITGPISTGVPSFSVAPPSLRITSSGVTQMGRPSLPGHRSRSRA